MTTLPRSTSRSARASAAAGLLLTFLAAHGCASRATTRHEPAPASSSPTTTTAAPARTASWRKLDTVKYPGKQDDIVFVTPDLGWYCNGSGRIYKTRDGGRTWAEQIHRPGTFFRCIGFVDSLRGFAGNVGPGYFPNVTDSIPLYETRDGGATWTPVTTIRGPAVKGLCAIDVVRSASGVVIHAGGRVGGPAALLRSDDGGETWQSLDLSGACGMILDVQFLDPRRGILCAATASDAKESNALILGTTDGGATWEPRYRSTRPYELTWKSSFPSPSVGYVTVQSYDPDSTVRRRVVAKTEDGGQTWRELTLAEDFKLREFGVGFVDERTGWVGGSTTGYETRDGGASWQPVEMGRAVNKIRLLRHAAGVTGYAIGVDVHKLEWAGD